MDASAPSTRPTATEVGGPLRPCNSPLPTTLCNLSVPHCYPLQPKRAVLSNLVVILWL